MRIAMPAATAAAAAAVTGTAAAAAAVTGTAAVRIAPIVEDGGGEAVDVAVRHIPQVRRRGGAACVWRGSECG